MKSSTTAIRRVTWQGTFSALKHRNYRLWFLGQLVSLVGTWMQTTAQGYLVYELTKSPAFLGYVGFAAGLPAWLFTLYGGLIADRLSRRALLLVTQTAMMILAFILAGLVFTRAVQPWHIITLALALGVANAFDAPARQAFVVELISRDDLTNAIALNSTMFNMATVVGPSIAGITYAWVGPGWCFTINAISFLAVIVALLFIRVQRATRPFQHTSALSELKEGLQYAANDNLTRTLIVNMGFLSLFGLSLMTLLPAWSVNILHGDVRTNGLLLSARGAGALIGALMIASLSQFSIRGRLWSSGSLLMPGVMLAFALARWLPLSTAIMMFMGWSFMVQANTSNAMVQTHLPDHLRGRVMGIYTLIFIGGMPLGALIAGSLANLIGEVSTVMINGLILLVVAVTAWIRLPNIRKTG